MSDRTIATLFREATRPLLSYEFFPPKDDAGLEGLREAALRLRDTRPDFVTVTHGAGGSSRGRTLEICEMLRDLGFSPVMPHMTCVGMSRRELANWADEIYARGFRNIMALRGDPPRGQSEFRPPPDGLAHASELVALLKDRHPDFCCGVAGYPEKHPEAPSLDVDIAHLRNKLAAGADFVTTQLFFENVVYFEFVERCRAAGITQPILPGIMPALSHRQIERFTSVCGASFPRELANQLLAAPNPAAAVEVGLAWASAQIEELLAKGVPGVHLYVLNRAHVLPLVDRFRGRLGWKALSA